MNLNAIAKAAADKILGGEKLNNLHIVEARMKTCLECPNFNTENERCRICLCFMEIKTTYLTSLNPAKGRYEKTHCPLGKWGDLDIANYYRELDGKELLKPIQNV